MTSRDSVQLEGLPEWYLSVAREYEACRERVGMMDMTSFSKFELSVSVDRREISLEALLF